MKKLAGIFLLLIFCVVGCNDTYNITVEKEDTNLATEDTSNEKAISDSFRENIDSPVETNQNTVSTQEPQKSEERQKQQKRETDTQDKASFYGIWCDAYKTKTPARQAASKLKGKGFDARVYCTTDWSNLNSEKWYVVTAGVYATKKAAKAALPDVRSVYASAYVKYSGRYQG